MFDLVFGINYLLVTLEVYVWADYFVGEIAYIILAFTAKSFLAWFTFSTTNYLVDRS